MLEVDHLVVGYGQTPLIRNLFFALPEPAFVAIIGHNGCGKTTFFKALLGQLPYQGTIRLLGKELDRWPRAELAALRSYLPQKNDLRFSLTVRELAVMGRFRFKRFLENYDAEDYALTDAVLQRLRLLPLADRPVNQLSGGEQQLVWLAQLLLQDAQLWLLDEPTQQLDVYNKRLLYELLYQCVQERQRTVLCITHDLQPLRHVQGHLLNLAKPQPQLEPISAESLQENLLFLEKD